MEVRLNEGGDPGFLVHVDLVWICRDRTERRQIQFNAGIISITAFTLTHTGAHHTLCPAPSALYPRQDVTLYVCAEQRYQGQAESPRAK